jgi:hypothetical protein
MRSSDSFAKQFELRFRAAVLGVILLSGTHPSLLAQAANTGSGQSTPEKGQRRDDPAQSATRPSAKEAREAQITADTEKLYKLAQELKTEMDKSTKDTLSLSVIRKASEIEQLARSLKEQLKKE